MTFPEQEASLLPAQDANLVPGEQFSYSQYDSETAKKIKAAGDEIRGLQALVTTSVVRIGRILIEQKKLIGHGNWSKWLRYEFDVKSVSSSSAYMSVFRWAKLNEIDDELQQFDPSASYILARQTTDEKATEEAISLARRGEYVTYTKAIDLRDKYRAIKDACSLALREDKTEDLAAPANLDPKTLPAEGKAGKNVKPIELVKLKVYEAAYDDSPALPGVPEVEVGSAWSLGSDGLLICQDPTTFPADALIPEGFDLSLCFPPGDRHLIEPDFPAKVEHRLRVDSADFDYLSYRNVIEALLLISTERNDLVAIVYLPDPCYPYLAHQRNCRFVALDPSPQRCQDALLLWSKGGLPYKPNTDYSPALS